MTQDRPARALSFSIPGVPRAGPRGRSIHRPAVDLEPAHLRGHPPGEDRHLLARRDRPSNQRSRDHGAESLHREGAVHGEAEQVRGVLPRDPGGDPVEGRDQSGKAFTRDRGDPDARGPLAERSPRSRGSPPPEVHPFALCFRLVEATIRGRTARSRADVEMLRRVCGITPVVRGDDLEDDVDPPRARHPSSGRTARVPERRRSASAPDGAEAGEPEARSYSPLLLLPSAGRGRCSQRAQRNSSRGRCDRRPEDHGFHMKVSYRNRTVGVLYRHGRLPLVAAPATACRCRGDIALHASRRGRPLSVVEEYLEAAVALRYRESADPGKGTVAQRRRAARSSCAPSARRELFVMLRPKRRVGSGGTDGCPPSVPYDRPFPYFRGDLDPLSFPTARLLHPARFSRARRKRTGGVQRGFRRTAACMRPHPSPSIDQPASASVFSGGKRSAGPFTVLARTPHGLASTLRIRSGLVGAP